MQSQAERLQSEVDAMSAELAAAAAKLAACSETIAVAVVHHPELQWEQKALGLLPKLGAAHDLLDRDKRLQDFKYVSSTH